MKRIIKKLSILVLIMTIFITGLNNKVLAENDGLDQLEMPEEGEEIAVIETNYGYIYIRLFEEIAPKAVENFKTHAKNGYYDNLIFHRVIEDFMIQGGDPLGNGTGGESIWGENFEDEFHPDYRNFRGALSLANSGPNTNGSQFFIVQASDVHPEWLQVLEEMKENNLLPESIYKAYKEKGGTPWLDGQHTVFGQVFENMSVVDEIGSVEVSQNQATKDKPIEDVVINKIDIVEYKKDMKIEKTKPISKKKSDNKPLVIGGLIFVLIVLTAMLRKRKVK